MSTDPDESERAAPDGDHVPGAVRERVWTAMMRAHVGAYPLPVHGHHPNFRGASAAAAHLLERLWSLGLLSTGATALCFPDYVLRGVRRGLLERGVHVVVPAQHGSGFRLLESGRVPAARAASIAGAERHGLPLDEPPPVALALVACVALARGGDYLRKGYGFRLPAEVALAPRATIVHPLQLVAELTESDGSVVLYATPEKAVRSGK